MADGSIAIGALTLRPGRELLRDGASIVVGGRTLALLSVLAEADGAVVTKDELFEAVWLARIVEDNALQVQVSQARKALGDEARRLVTVHGRGYRLAVDSPPRLPASVAVLPFANLTGDPGNAYLGDGMAEELLVILSRAKGLRVPARTSSFAYRGRDVDVRTIARDLGVEAMLEGSVRVAGERIRVTVQLIEAETGFHLWSENYDRRFGDLLVLQDEIAATIAGALRTQLGVEQLRTPDFEAHHLYLRARALCENQRPADFFVALDLLDQAIERDPGFAGARAQRGYGVHLGIMHGTFSPDRHGQVSADAEFALALDPDDSRIHALNGLVCATKCDWLGAQEAYCRSFATEGCDPAECGNFGYYVLASLGRFHASIEQFEIARKAAPADPGIAGMHGFLFALWGDFEPARELLDHAFNLGFPRESLHGSYIQALFALASGDIERAVATLSAATLAEWRELGAAPVFEQTLRALVFKADRITAATDLKALFDRSREVGSVGRTDPLYAYTLSWLGCLGALDEAYDVADCLTGSFRKSGFLSPVILLALWNPWMRPFREDTRFQDFVRALNMFEYWEQHGPPDGHAIENDRLICL